MWVRAPKCSCCASADGRGSMNGLEAGLAGDPMQRMTMSLPATAMLLLALVSAAAAQPASPVPDSKATQYQAKGEQDRTYTFPGTGESVAYHIYVPTKWDRSMRLPLVVVPHGANQPPTA